jgi:hypothetical protein
MNSGPSPPSAIVALAGALTPTAATRDTAAWVAFLNRLEVFNTAGEAYLIIDALPLHCSHDTMLWN